jgi:hypothetical protein
MGASGAKLTTELLVLGFTLDLNDGGSNRVASSCALALAKLPSASRYAGWLRALTQRLNPGFRRPQWLDAGGLRTPESVAYRLAVLLGMARAGDGIGGRSMLNRPELDAALTSIDDLLRRLKVYGGADGVRTELQRWPCPECGNARAVRKVVGGTALWRICAVCGGVPGERMSNGQLVVHLRAESELLEGSQKSWAAQVAADQGAPFIDLDPASVPTVFGVDPTRTIFRDGRWIRPQ